MIDNARKSLPFINRVLIKLAEHTRLLQVGKKVSKQARQ